MRWEWELFKQKRASLAVLRQAQNQGHFLCLLLVIETSLSTMMKFLLALLGIHVYPLWAQETSCRFSDTIEVLEDLVSVTQKTSLEQGTVQIEVAYAGLGWIGFGFSEKGEMLGSTGKGCHVLIMGVKYVTSQPLLYSRYWTARGGSDRFSQSGQV